MTIYKTPLRSIVNFTFAVVEFCDLKVLLQREQHYLDILFSLPTNLRYNFLPTAGSSLGYKHTPETLAEVSGANNSMYGKVAANAFESGNVPAKALESDNAGANA